MEIKKNIAIQHQKEIDLAAETLAKIFLQQILNRKNPEVNKRIDKYGKSNA